MKKFFIAIQILVTVLFIAIILNITFVNTSRGITNKYLYYQITTSSMQTDNINSINVSDIIIVERNLENDFYDNLNIGDVITFEMTSGVLSDYVITHRIINISVIDNIYYITTKGDNATNIEIIDTSSDILYGRVVYTSSNLGIVYNILSNTFVICLLIIAPCSIIIVLEIKKIIKMKGEIDG